MIPFFVTYTDGKYTNNFTVQADDVNDALKKAKVQLGDAPWTHIDVEAVTV